MDVLRKEKRVPEIDPAPMRLFHSTTSPFVRKVMVLAHETGLVKDIVLVSVVASPVRRAASVVAYNPTGHIPTLVLQDGTALYDSGVICRHLDRLHRGPPFFPVDPDRQSRALCLQALADGIMSASVLIRFETALRPAQLQWQAWIDGQMSKIESSIDELTRNWLEHVRDQLDIGTVSVACALSYLDFREIHLTWRQRAPALAEWYADFSRRDSMQATGLRAPQ